MKGSGMGFDPKKKAIDELMSYLDGKDGEELGSAMKPKDAHGLEVTKIEALGDDGKPEGDEQSPGVMPDEGGEGDKPKMSPEEIEELIEALQAKVGS
jgi:hypothetical protein